MQPLVSSYLPVDPDSYRSSPNIISASAATVPLPVTSPPATAAPALAIITDGGSRFDRSHLEHPNHRPAVPNSTIYCNELVGADPLQRGLALLAGLRQRRQAGEFSPFVPTLVFMHGEVVNGELLLTDKHGSIQLPAIVLFHWLSSMDGLPASFHSGLPPAPIVLSCCHAERFASQLKSYPRPVLINGSEYGLSHIDAEMVFHRCVTEAALAWKTGRPLDADQLFDAISHTSGEPVHRIEAGYWETHHLLTSGTSLEEIGGSQEILYLQAMLAHGSVNRLAEALLLFGFDGLHSCFQWDRETREGNPVLCYLSNVNARDLAAKIVLMTALGEDIDQSDFDGNTLLHRACSCAGDDDDDPGGDEILAKLLLANGANPLLENDDGMTPVDLAETTGNEALISLFDPDADTSDYDNFRLNRMIVRARSEGWGSVLSLLRERGFDTSETPEPQSIENSDS